MTDVAMRRLQAQRLVGEPFSSIEEAIGWLGAVQSQDYAAAKWALGQRTRGVIDADLDRSFDRGTFLRTHVMRPTWHFVLPADIQWLLDLTRPRVKAALAYYDRQLGIDPKMLKLSQAIMKAALRNHSYRTRSELGAQLERQGIPAGGQRHGNLLLHAELDLVITSGPRRGKQFTYALLEERAPDTRRLDRDEALAELTRRYFTSHGPAQAQDFAWWSGLTVADVRHGLESVGSALVREEIGGKSYWSAPEMPAPPASDPVAHLLPNYDEFLVAYQDRTALLGPARRLDAAVFPRGSILANVVVLQGQILGSWKRRLEQGRLIVELVPLDILDGEATAPLRRAAGDLARFLGEPLSQLVVVPPSRGSPSAAHSGSPSSRARAR